MIAPFTFGSFRAMEGLRSGLLAFWKLQNLQDSSGNDNELTNSGTVVFESGKIGNAASFDGSNDVRNTSFPCTTLQDFSFNLWIKRIGNGFARCGFSLGAQSNFASVGVYSDDFTGNRLNVAWWGVTEVADTVNDTTIWRHVVLTYDSANQTGKIYFDGSIFSTEIVASNHSDGVIIGNSPQDQFLIGQVDAVGIWNRVLSESEILALYNNGNGLEL